MKKMLRPYIPHITIVILAGLFLFVVSSYGTYLYFAKDLKSKETVMNRKNTGLVLYDRNGKPFFSFYEGKYTRYIPLSEVPKSVQHAVISAEDKSFYSHPGFSVSGIIRSVINNFSQGEVVSGGSTITQQLVKNALLTPKRDFMRKYQELILAQELERKFTKDEILEMYLNSVYFGEGAFGIGEASQTYFGKKPSDLNIAQASMLAGLLPAPSRYTPQGDNRDTTKKRQTYVLASMVESKFITQEQMDKALKEKLSFQIKEEDINNTALHFAVMVRDQLIREYGEEHIIRSGFRVKTSIDLSFQRFAEKTVAEHVAELAGNNVSNGASVVIDPDNGQIISLVGSIDWYNADFGKVNVATQTRQPGSSFKPIVYALAMEEGKVTPATILTDSPTKFEGNYEPKDYDKRYRGKVLARRALANSLNIPSVDVMSRVGVPAVLDYSKQLGISTLREPVDYGLSLVLGTGEVKLTELTNAYATFAHQGKHNPVTSVLQINDKDGNNIYSYTPVNEQVIEPGVAFLISSILSDNRTRAEVFGNALNISRQAAVKTGTTENYKDAWTIGYTPQVAVGVWVGNNDGAPMDQIAGSLGAAPIWKALIEKYISDLPVMTFIPPDNVIAKSVCTSNGLVAQASTGGAREEYFISGTQPKTVDRCFVPTPTGEENKDNEDQEPGDETARIQESVRREQQRLEREIEERFTENRRDNSSRERGRGGRIFN